MKKIGTVGLMRAESGTVVAIPILAEVIKLTPALAYKNIAIIGYRPVNVQDINT